MSAYAKLQDRVLRHFALLSRMWHVATQTSVSTQAFLAVYERETRVAEVLVVGGS